MSFIHAREYLQEGDAVIVNCDTQCNVIIMTDSEFANYKSGRQFRHYGGFYKMFPASILVPHADHWNTVLDLAGGHANIRYSITYAKSG
jgi:peptidyl-tRNA hydrolase